MLKLDYGRSLVMVLLIAENIYAHSVNYYVHYTGLQQFQNLNYKENHSQSLTWMSFDKQGIVM
jgi:hypothetical protein